MPERGPAHVERGGISRDGGGIGGDGFGATTWGSDTGADPGQAWPPPCTVRVATLVPPTPPNGCVGMSATGRWWWLAGSDGLDGYAGGVFGEGPQVREVPGEDRAAGFGNRDDECVDC